MRKALLGATVTVMVLCAASTALSQTPDPDRRWNVEFGIGWDNSISGNINSGAIGTLNNQTVVILKNQYEDVYGTGLHLRFGGGYMLDDLTEVLGIFTYQSLDADLVPMGDIGVSRLYAQYAVYQSFGLDVGLRRYANASRAFRPYGDATIGLGFIDKTDVRLAAPTANLDLAATDFYDQTAAFAFGVNAGVLWRVRDRVDAFVQIGMRYTTGMAEVDDLVGTGLDSINDNSSRWTVPFVFGVRGRF